jgi:hypothetical protein
MGGTCREGLPVDRPRRLDGGLLDRLPLRTTRRAEGVDVVSTVEEQAAPWTIAELHWAVKLIAHELRRADGNPEYREVLLDSIEGFLDQLLERLPPAPPLARKPRKLRTTGRPPP